MGAEKQGNKVDFAGLPVAHLPESAQERGRSQNNLGAQHSRRQPLHSTRHRCRIFWKSATSTTG
jgi:hypothetical protein